MKQTSNGWTPQRVYLDTCILGLPFDTETPQGVAEAIGDLCDFEHLEFLTSKKTLRELMKHRDPDKRNLLKLIYRLMSKLPQANLLEFVPATFGSMMFGEATFGGGAANTDPLFSALTRLFEKDDAEHIFQAIKGECQFFLTLDWKTILKRSRRHRSHLNGICPGLRFVAPQELVPILRESNRK
jgi:predicted nucleic acid-binding protein